VFDNDGLAVNILIAAAIFLVIAVLQHSRLWRFSEPQIDAIAGNYDATLAVRAEFDAL
jgi:hypothetical protein